MRFPAPFKQALAVISFYLCLFPPFAAHADDLKMPDGEMRGVWIHTYAPRNWQLDMEHLAAAHFNNVFVRVARGANTIYPSKYLPGDDWTGNLTADEMQRAIDAAHDNHLQFHAWMVCFHVGGASKQSGPAKQLYDQMAKDDRLVRGPTGEQAPFLNPADPRNQQLELNIAREIVEKYDIDGLHLDYIRYPDEPNFDFDYGEVSRREFEKATKKKVANWPKDVLSGDLKWEYENWERSNIDNLVRQIYEQTKKLKPQVQVSAAVWRAHRHNRATIKQDWLLWAKRGWLDFVVPMDYTPDDKQFREDLQGQIPNATGKIGFLAGIGAYQHADAAATLRQIQIARAEGADGWVLFDYKPEKQTALFDTLTRADAVVSLPSTAHPKVLWSVEGTAERKDAPPLVEIGKSITVTVAPQRGAAGQELIGALIRLETIDGQWINWPGKVENMMWPNGSWAPLRYTFAVPQGRSRVVFGGTLKLDDQNYSFFTVHGPMVEGFTSPESSGLKERKSNKPPPVDEVAATIGRRVVIYNGQASSGIVKGFERARVRGVQDFDVVTTDTLDPKTWKASSVFILPQLRDVAELTPTIQKELRDWVKAGGTLILTHDAVGFRWHLRLFPEIGEGVALSKSRNIEVLDNKMKLTPGAWSHNFPDHVIIAPGQDGVVLANETGTTDKAVLVGGKFGEGKVFLYGTLLGYAPDGEIGDEERQLLVEMAK